MIKDSSGTPAYMAPETFSEKAYNPFLADIWALGILLFTFLNGHPPFKQRNRTSMKEQILSAKFKFEKEVSQEAIDLCKYVLSLFSPFNSGGVPLMNNIDNNILNKMKAVLLVAALLVASVVAYERLWAKGDVLLDILQNGKDELHIVKFYDPTNTPEIYGKVRENDRVTHELLEYMKTLDEGGENAFPTKVFYSTVDATDPYNANIIHKADFNQTVLDDGPVIVTLRHQSGNLQYGAQVIPAVKKSIEELKTQEQ